MDEAKEKNQDGSKTEETEEKSYEAFFGTGKAEADGEKDKALQKILQHQGFQIATLPQGDIHALLDRETEALSDTAKTSETEWKELYDTVIADLKRKAAIIEEDILKIKDQNEHDEAIAELKNKKIIIENDIEKLKESLIKVRETLAGSKKGIGEKLVSDVESEMIKVAQLQKTIYIETKFINEDRHKNTKDVLAAYVQKLRDLRASYKQRFELIEEKIKVLGADGINMGVARLLMTLGTATAGAAGYFFAIFSARANYSSQDALYYLLKNILESTNKSDTPFWLKLAYLLAGLVLITGFSWVVDHLLEIKTFHSEKNKELESFNFSTAFKVEGMSYEQKSQSKTWLVLWLRIAPLALVIGMAITVLSKESGIVGDTNMLSASTEGLLIGTVLAMGFSAITYVYIVKAIETRSSASRMAYAIKNNWELVGALMLFIAVITAFMFYKDFDLKNNPLHSPFSIAGFLGCCAVTAFAFAYGVRYLGLHQSLLQTEYQIDYIDRKIAHHSGPEQIILDIDYGKNLADLASCLTDNLNRKAELLKPYSQKDTAWKVAKQTLGNVSKTIINIPKLWGSKTDLEESNLFEILEWEIEYFPEYAEQLKILATIYKDKKRQLTETEAGILKHTGEKQKASESIKSELAVLRKKVDALNTLEAKATKHYIEFKILRTETVTKSIVSIRDGFNLGLWYRKHEMGDEI